MEFISNAIRLIKAALLITILIWWSKYCFALGVQENPSLCHGFILTAF